MEEIGIGDKLLWLPSNVGYFADGKILPTQWRARTCSNSPIIPFHDRLRLGATTVYLQNVKDWKKYEKVTAEEWLTSALGKRGYEKTLGAQLDAKFGSYAERLRWSGSGAKSGFAPPRAVSPLEQEKLGYIKGSFNALIDALEQALREHGVELHVGHGPSRSPA